MPSFFSLELKPSWRSLAKQDECQILKFVEKSKIDPPYGTTLSGTALYCTLLYSTLREQWQNYKEETLSSYTTKKTQTYRKQNGKQYNRKTNSAQSALARRVRQGSTGPPPLHSTPNIGRVQNFCFRISQNSPWISQNSKLFVKISCFAKFDKIILNFAKFEENFA